MDRDPCYGGGSFHLVVQSPYELCSCPVSVVGLALALVVLCHLVWDGFGVAWAGFFLPDPVAVSVSLALRQRTKCGTCGSVFFYMVIHQPPLLKHGGYGEATKTTIESCGCPFVRVVSKESEAP